MLPSNVLFKLPKAIHFEQPLFAARRMEIGNNKGSVEGDWAS